MITCESNRQPLELDGLLRRALCERVIDAAPSRRVRADVLRVATIARVQNSVARERAAWFGWAQMPPHINVLLRIEGVRAQFDRVRLLL